MGTPAGGTVMTSRLDEFFEGQPDRMSPKDVAILLGVTDAAVYVWLRDGVIPGYQLGRTWVILRDELKDTLLAGQSAALRSRAPGDESPGGP